MRLFIVIATRTVNSESMFFDMHVRIEVYARDKNDAMKKVRSEFRNAFLRVEE